MVYCPWVQSRLRNRRLFCETFTSTFRTFRLHLVQSHSRTRSLWHDGKRECTRTSPTGNATSHFGTRHQYHFESGVERAHLSSCLSATSTTYIAHVSEPIIGLVQKSWIREEGCCGGRRIGDEAVGGFRSACGKGGRRSGGCGCAAAVGKWNREFFRGCSRTGRGAVGGGKEEPRYS